MILFKILEEFLVLELWFDNILKKDITKYMEGN